MNSSTELPQLLTTNSNDLLRPFISPRHGPCRKHSLSVVEKACLLIRCVAMDVMLLRVLAPARMCLPSRCLAIGLYVTGVASGLHARVVNVRGIAYNTENLSSQYVTEQV
jgi:hypothetical protein